MSHRFLVTTKLVSTLKQLHCLSSTDKSDELDDLTDNNKIFRNTRQNSMPKDVQIFAPQKTFLLGEKLPKS